MGSLGGVKAYGDGSKLNHQRSRRGSMFQLTRVPFWAYPSGLTHSHMNLSTMSETATRARLPHRLQGRRPSNSAGTCLEVQRPLAIRTEDACRRAVRKERWHILSYLTSDLFAYFQICLYILSCLFMFISVHMCISSTHVHVFSCSIMSYLFIRD